MTSRAKVETGYSQLRPVLLLLAVAVIAPAVCLLWFMNQAVKNAELAARQIVINTYEKELADLGEKTDRICGQSQGILDEKISNASAYESLGSLVVECGYDGVLIYGDDGHRVYPLLAEDLDPPTASAERFADVWQIEFRARNYAKAVRVYEEMAESNDSRIRLKALIGKSRCLMKLDRSDEAVEVCRQVAFSPLEDKADPATLALIGNARLLLIKYLRRNEKYAPLFEETLKKLPAILYTSNSVGAAMPADNNLFLARKIFEIIAAQAPSLDGDIKPVMARLQKLMVAEERSVRIAEYFPTAGALDDWQVGRFRRLQVGREVVYGLYHKSGGRTALLLSGRERIASALADYEKAFADSDAVYRILDDSQRLVAGAPEPTGMPFVTAFLGERFPGWKIELYFKAADIFEKASSRQVAVYTWAGVLVIGLVFAAGGVAARAVGKQIKLNRMKNDFIATVSHELKTPLASMRVLVDTLLEGNYTDPKQVTEYLRLTAKENERLSRLIDNFLTFSRMERNRQSFEMVRTDPADIAGRAAEAVKARFGKDRCRFDTSVDENLPEVLADSDAMVTVLLNLLDNAYKYSRDDKQIALGVFRENGSVCFCVSDNGVGLSRRAAKKIFRKFYQVDRSLSRDTGGCGLGLSIVEFIVDAHKGAISVDSEPGQGSRFTIKLAAIN